MNEICWSRDVIITVKTNPNSNVVTTSTTQQFVSELRRITSASKSRGSNNVRDEYSAFIKEVQIEYVPAHCRRI